jgi:hypothetical protein
MEGGSEGLAAGASGVPESAGASEAGSQQGMPVSEAAGAMPEEKPITPEQFRKFQSEADKRFAAIQKEAESSKHGMMAALQYIAQLEAANDQLQMAGSPPEILQAREKERALGLEKMQLEAEKQQILPLVKQAILLQIAQQYEVPLEELEGATSRREAELIAQAYRKYSRRGKLEERAAKGTDKQEGSSPTAATDISNIKDSTRLLDMAFKKRGR